MSNPNTNTYLMNDFELQAVAALEVLKTFQLYGKCDTIQEAIDFIDMPDMEPIVEQRLAKEIGEFEEAMVEPGFVDELKSEAETFFGPWGDDEIENMLGEIFGVRLQEEDPELDLDFDDDEDDFIPFEVLEDDDLQDFDDPKEPSWPNTGPAKTTAPTVPPVCQAVASWPNTGPAVAVAPAPVAAVAAAPIVSPKSRPKKSDILRQTVARDNRQRACVPVEMAKRVGFKENSPVFVSHRNGGNGLVLLKKASQTGHLSTYLVDSYGNIRLSQYILRTGGLASGPVKFRIADDGHGILVLQG